MARIFRHIKDGFLGVFRHFALSLSSISSVTVTLLIMSVFLFLGANVSGITHEIEKNVQIHVQIEDDLSEESDISELIDGINKINGVSSVEFSSKSDELDYWIASDSTGDSEELFGGFRGENNPFKDALLVTVTNGDKIKEVTESVRDLDGVYRAIYGGDSTAQLLNNLQQIRNAGFIIVAFLGIIAVFLISNTIRVSIHSRRKEINIMRTVGATNWYIRWPFIIEGIIIGMIGSIIPVLISIFGYRYLFNKTNGYILSQMFKLMPLQPLAYQVSGILVGIGMLVGALGSMLTVGKYLRWSR